MKAKCKAEQLKEYKAAQTPKEMVESWAPPVDGAKTDVLHDLYRVFEEKAPEISKDILKNFIHDPEIKMMERSILDPKLVELIRLMIAVKNGNSARITMQVIAAKARGAKDEEIVDIAWLASYGSAKGALGQLGNSFIEGYKFSEMIRVKENYAAGKKAGKDAILNYDEEVAAFASACDKTQWDMLMTWMVWIGMEPEMIAGAQKMSGSTFFDEKAPQLNIIKDHFHDPLPRGYERWAKGRGLSPKDKEIVELVGCMAHPTPGAVTAHTPFLFARGTTDEELMEICYLFCVEYHKNMLEKIGPALAEGFRQAADLGL